MGEGRTFSLDGEFEICPRSGYESSFHEPILMFTTVGAKGPEPVNFGGILKKLEVYQCECGKLFVEQVGIAAIIR